MSRLAMQAQQQQQQQQMMYGYYPYMQPGMPQQASAQQPGPALLSLRL